MPATPADRTLEAPQYAGFLLRSIRAFGRRAGDSDPAVAAEYFAELRAAIDRAEREAIGRWLADEYWYRDLARVYGVVHHTLIQRFRRLTDGAAA